MKKLALAAVLMTLQTLEVQSFNPHEFTFNGYLRTGIGRSEGGQMVDFTTPEIAHKYRMGNEANHYGELQFNYRYKNKDSANVFEVTYMMSQFVPYGTEREQKFPETAQLYGKLNDIVKGADIWVGRRYYMRKNVEMLDYFWLNSAQSADVGFGIEDFKLKNGGNLNLAVIQFNYPETDKKSNNSYVTDFRYLDLPISENSKLNFLAQYGYKEADSVQKLPKHHGYTLGVWWDYQKKNISNTTTLLFRKGSTIVTSPYSGKTISEYNGNYRIYDLVHALSLDLIQNFVYDDKLKHAIQATLVYQYRDFGIGNVDAEGTILDNRKSKNAVSAGFRYLYYLSKNFNLAVEAGVDYVKSSKLGLEGSLQKITFSPQITWDYGYYSRPVIRPFVTYAHWSDDFKGTTGISSLNTRLSNKNHGVSFGLQLEVWW